MDEVTIDPDEPATFDAERVHSLLGSRRPYPLLPYRPGRGRTLASKYTTTNDTGARLFVKCHSAMGAQGVAALGRTVDRSTAFQARLHELGAPLPRVLPVGSARFGAVPIGSGHPDGLHVVFTVHEMIEGLREPDRLDPVDVRRVLVAAGATSALMQVAATGIGPLATYPDNGPAAWERRVDALRASGHGGRWVESLATSAASIGAIELTLPADPTRPVAPVVRGDMGDRGENNIEVDANGRAVVVDWDDVFTIESHPLSMCHGWERWAARGRAVGREAQAILLRAFRSTLAAHDLRPGMLNFGGGTTHVRAAARTIDDLRSVLTDAVEGRDARTSDVPGLVEQVHEHSLARLATPVDEIREHLRTSEARWANAELALHARAMFSGPPGGMLG